MKTVQLNIDEQVRASQNKTAHGEEQCVSAHTNLLAQFDSDYLKSCDQSVDLGAISWKLSLIHAQIWMCKFATDPTLCYDDFGKQIDLEIENGEEVCNKAPMAASECFDAKYDEALEIISKADMEFAHCNV
ncbi:hypothetical protein RI129_007888 [Pyrocoelia pectoralis]|uniref:Uncharacterized protein n=1 Tax=Pyrocoelia pectoralis TaxID=417401 RepID=A0AAN7VEZ2_9COLE